MGVIFRKYQIENNLRDKLFLVNLIHDEAIAEVADGYEEQGRQIIENSMVKGAMAFCKKVKMKAEAVVVQYWHH